MLATSPARPRQLTKLGAERKARDDLIWNALPPLNMHLQVHEQVKAFKTPPASARVPRWETKAFVGVPAYKQPDLAFSRLDLVNTQRGEILPQEKLLKGLPWPGDYPDDGTGIFLSKRQFPELSHDIYYTPLRSCSGSGCTSTSGCWGPAMPETTVSPPSTSRKATRRRVTTPLWCWCGWRTIGRPWR